MPDGEPSRPEGGPEPIHPADAGLFTDGATARGDAGQDAAADADPVYDDEDFGCVGDRPCAIVELSAAHFRTCARRRDGRVLCWGLEPVLSNANDVRPVPTLQEGTQTFVSLAAGGYHTCALDADRSTYCWGRNGNAQLGDGTLDPSAEPVRVARLADVVALDAGWYTVSCAVHGDGATACWGSGRPLLRGLDGSDFEPTAIPDLPDCRDVRVGEDHACAQAVDGSLYCWGDNSAGQLGVGEHVEESPTPLRAVGGQVRTFDAGHSTTCAIFADESVHCWGDGMAPGSDPAWRPREIDGAPTGTGGVATGWGFACSVGLEGAVHCWGLNSFGSRGRAGDGAGPYPYLPPARIDGPENVREVVAGLRHACAREASGRIWCWGDNSFGQLGNGGTGPAHHPGPVRIPE